MKQGILFRGKITGTENWIFGLPFAVYSENDIDSIQDCKTKEIEYVDIDTVGRFTGLTESKNHPMFDDKIKLWEDDIFTIGKYGTKYKATFENFEWIGVSNHGDDWGKFKIRFSAIKEPIHILGNIHDNPEIFEAA